MRLASHKRKRWTGASRSGIASLANVGRDRLAESHLQSFPPKTAKLYPSRSNRIGGGSISADEWIGDFSAAGAGSDLAPEWRGSSDARMTRSLTWPRIMGFEWRLEEKAAWLFTRSGEQPN